MKQLLAGVVLTCLSLIAGVSAQQRQPEAIAPGSVVTGWWSPLWTAGGGPLWFGSHPPGHELTVDEVRDRLGLWIQHSGNPRLKVGTITEKDSRTITAEITTVESSLVQRIYIDRRTGMVWQETGADGTGAWQQWGPPHTWRPWMEIGEGWRRRPDDRSSIPIIGIFILSVVVVVLMVLFLRALDRRHRGVGGWWGPSARDELDTRYVQGLIHRDEYLRKKAELAPGR